MKSTRTNRTRLGVAAVIAFLMVIAGLASPASGGTSNNWGADDQHALQRDPTTRLELNIDLMPISGSGTVQTTYLQTLNLPFQPGNYRHATSLIAPDTPELGLRVARFPGTGFGFANLVVRCAPGNEQMVATGNLFVYWGQGGTATNKPFVGLFYQSDGNLVIYHYAGGGDKPMSGQEYLWGTQVLGSKGLNFAHGTLSVDSTTDSGTWNSNTSCNPRPAGTGLIKRQPTSLGTCLVLPDGPGNSTGNTQLTIRSCDPSLATQQWTYDSTAKTLKAFGRCMEVQGSSTNNGTPITVNTCNGQPNQKWTYNSSSQEWKPDIGKCLDVDHGDTTNDNDTKVQLYDCNGTSAQNWSQL